MSAASTDQGRQTISACLVVRNGAADLERCLDSLRGAVDEIVFVHDGPCADGSLAIAARHGARIFVRPLAGVCEAHRAFAFAQSRGDWILLIDADEFLPEATRCALPELVARADVDAYCLCWPAHRRGRNLRRGPYARMESRCLLRRSRMYFLAVPHLPPGTYGTLCRRLDLVKEHRPAQDNYTFAALRRKFLPWSRLEARMLRDCENLPRFQMDEPDHPELRRCRRRSDHPLWSCLDEVGGYTWLSLKNGLLGAGPESWRIWFFVSLRIVSVYWYLLKQPSRKSQIPNPKDG